MVTKVEKCEFCGCRGGSTICYYNCGCHKPTDEKVLPKQWSQEIVVKLIRIEEDHTNLIFIAQRYTRVF